MKHFVIVYFLLALCRTSFSQTLHNPKNVDRTAATLHYGQQTFRAIEYTVDPSPQSEKIYRLGALAENGFPAIDIYGTDNSSTVFFEDKVPYLNVFTDNPTPYLSAEAVELHFGFQTAMKTFDQRFGWKGMDGNGTDPIKISIENSDGTSNDYSYARYSGDMNNKFFAFGKSVMDNTPLPTPIDIVGHELSHAIMKHRSNISYLTNLCTEYRSIDEGFADIFGIYIKNKFLQSTPQNYNWLIGEGILSKPNDIRDPKSYKRADTYKGEYFDNGCSDNYNYIAGGGIATKWFYLLTSGFAGTATNDLGYTYSNLTGIGIEKAIQIVWNVIPDLKTTSKYPSLRNATLLVAQQLYGLNSTEYQAVEKAWCAVGVCDNNLPFFTLSPINTAANIDPWPDVNVNFSWEDNPHVKKVLVQMSRKYDFSDTPQNVEVSSFDLLFKPGGGAVYVGTAKGYFHPGETVYVRAKITETDPNFCKGLNPLCKLYQQFGPANAFKLDEKKTAFWHAIPQAGFSVNIWNNPSIYWKPVSNAEKYTFQVATDKNFSNLVYTGTTNYTGNHPESGLINTVFGVGKYYVRARAERKNIVKIINNFGEWSKTDSVQANVPATSVKQALNQKANDPATAVSNLGFAVDWYTVPGADSYIIQVASDNLFANILHSVTAAGNVTNAVVPLPDLPNQSFLHVRILPKKVNFPGTGTCTNIWRIKTDQSISALAMTLPLNGYSFSFKSYTGGTFEWSHNTVEPKLIAKTHVEVTKNSSNAKYLYKLAGKPLSFYLNDQLMFDDLLGLKVRVGVENALGVISAWSQPFDYNVCPDHPFPKFPSDVDKIDPTKAFTITWDPSQSIKPGDNYLVTLSDNAGPVSGFNNAQTTATSMVVPAGKLAANKIYAMVIKNSGSCPAVEPFSTLVHTIAGGNNNPQPAVVKPLDVQLIGYRNDLGPTKPFETSDYVLGLEMRDPNGAKVNIVDGNGMPITQLLVDSENSVLVIPPTPLAVGKYTLHLEMLNIFNPLLYNLFDQPKFSVKLNGTTVISDHVITVSPDPVYNAWSSNFKFAPIVLDHK